MDLIIVLGVTTLIVWLLRFFRFFSWMTLPIAVSCGLAMMFLSTGIAHFTPMKQDLVRMVPAIFPYRPLSINGTKNNAKKKLCYLQAPKWIPPKS